VRLLPHGLRAALHAAQQQQLADPEHADKMLNAALVALHLGWKWLMMAMGMTTHEKEAETRPRHTTGPWQPGCSRGWRTTCAGPPSAAASWQCRC
jgi:hypothetical protein